jgi:predicted alpha/beta hydrolase
MCVSPGAPIELRCRDGVTLAGHVWEQAGGGDRGTVIVNPATGVLARYYHRYAAFLAEAGFWVLTYDYRGIGASRPASLRGCGFRWRDWGERDFDAALRHVEGQGWPGPVQVVGHSIGGFLPGLSPRASRIDRMLTVGAQYAWWRDYAAPERARLFWKWHVAMPALTFAFGYFPGRRLGWLEDLPSGVALEWSFRRRRMETAHPATERAGVLGRFAAVSAPILAVGVSDDALGTPAAIARTLAYYSGAVRTQILLRPADLGLAAIGHFDLFHDRHRPGFWAETLRWLEDGTNPWPKAVVAVQAAGATAPTVSRASADRAKADVRRGV